MAGSPTIGPSSLRGCNPAGGDAVDARLLKPEKLRVVQPGYLIQGRDDASPSIAMGAWVLTRPAALLSAMIPQAQATAKAATDNLRNTAIEPFIGCTVS